VRPSVGIEAPARRLKLDFSPLLLEDYYLGKREAIEREHIEEIIARLKSPKFADHVRGLPVTIRRAPAKLPTSATYSDGDWWDFAAASARAFNG
jgi:hypothetical protein